MPINRTWKLVLAGLMLGVLNPAWAGDAKPAKAVRAQAPAEGTQSVSSVSSLGGGAGGGAAAASYARQADTGQLPCSGEPAPAPAPESANANAKAGPGRISSNLPVPKQTQGATLGEKLTRTALQNAASIADLMVTTEAMVAEAPK